METLGSGGQSACMTYHQTVVAGLAPAATTRGYPRTLRGDRKAATVGPVTYTHSVKGDGSVQGTSFPWEEGGKGGMPFFR